MLESYLNIYNATNSYLESLSLCEFFLLSFSISTMVILFVGVAISSINKLARKRKRKMALRKMALKK